MMRTRRAAVRAAVLWTNGIWPFSRLNRVPYRLALDAFVRACRQEPSIACVYLRNGLAREDWVPGLSDIDLTAIFGDRQPIDAGRLKTFWARYDRIKRVFPMLGDVDLFTAGEIRACGVTARGRETRGWKLLTGSDVLSQPTPTLGSQEAIDALNRSLLYYQTFFLQRFYTPLPSSSAIRSAHMLRLGRRLVMDAYTGLQDHRDPFDSTAAYDEATLLRVVLAALDDAVVTARRAIADDGVPPVGLETNTHVLRRIRSEPVFEPLLHDEAIHSILVAYHTRIIVVRPDAAPSQLTGCLVRIRDTFSGDPRPPLIVTARILDHMVRFHDPFLYTHLKEFAEIVTGEDVVSAIAPPPESAFRAWLLEQVPTLIIFSRSRALLTTPDAAWYAGRDVESAFERALFVRMFLDTGQVIPFHEPLLESCRERYGAFYERWQRVQAAAARADTIAARQEAFTLLHAVIGDFPDAVAAAGSALHGTVHARALSQAG